MTEESSSASPARLEAAVAEFLEALERGQTPDRARLLAGYADVAEELAEFLADHDRMNAWAAPLVQKPPSATPRGGTEQTIAAGDLSRNAAKVTAAVECEEAGAWR